MKRFFYFPLLGWMMISHIAFGQSQPPVNPNASPEAVKLLQFLYQVKGQYILSGQFNVAISSSQETEKINQITGAYPMIWSKDIGTAANSQDVQSIIDQSVEQYNKGSIIVLSWFVNTPFDTVSMQEGVPADEPDDQWNPLTTEGTSLHNYLLSQMDMVAPFLKQLQNKNIPVLWRPYYEVKGSRFWSGNIQGSRYKTVWRIMYNRLANYHQLNNLLWVWNANAPKSGAQPMEDSFPGHAMVDVISLDIFNTPYQQQFHDDLVQLANGKPIAFGECGQVPASDLLTSQPQWTWFMFCNEIPNDASKEESIRNLYQHQKTVTLNEMAWK